jgi:metallo-beta-lactamase family protein
MIDVEFLGAAQSVTGSRHLLRTSRASVLLDCGLFQGRRKPTTQQNRNLPLDARELDAVVLSHAHIDHSGALPVLCRSGFEGPIYATSPTIDLCAPMLMDAAMLQEADARHVQRLIERGADIDPVTPLFGQDDVPPVLSQMVGLPYHRPQVIAPGITVQFLEAGHVLGSAIVVLDIEDEGRTTRVAFTGDLGRHHVPILRDPEVPTGVETLITESTYGDRMHDPIERAGEALAQAVRRTCERGGKIVIPAFALERAQELIYDLKLLREARQIPPIPVYVDSPLTVKLTDVFRLHPECYDKDARELLQRSSSPFEFPGLRYVSEVEDSKALDADDGPSIIIAGSGMCEGGRVLHHLRAIIGDPRHTIVIVGFQAQHTLGRRLVERRPEVRIFGLVHDRRAEVVVLNGFSAHADQRELLDFAEQTRRKGPLRQVILVHGEPAAQAALSAELGKRHFADVRCPALSERISL